MVLKRVIQSKLVQDTTKKVLKEVDEIKEASKAKKIKKLEDDGLVNENYRTESSVLSTNKYQKHVNNLINKFKRYQNRV